VQKNLALTGIRLPDRSSCSESLYRLRYPRTVYRYYYVLKMYFDCGCLNVNTISIKCSRYDASALGQRMMQYDVTRIHHVMQLTLYTNLQLPVQVCTGPYGSRRLRLSGFLDSRHMKVAEVSALRTGHLYPPGDIPRAVLIKLRSRSKSRSLDGFIEKVFVQILCEVSICPVHYKCIQF
jgi:hypothetical protein